MPGISLILTALLKLEQDVVNKPRLDAKEEAIMNKIHPFSGKTFINVKVR
jgi:hypothetical protein